MSHGSVRQAIDQIALEKYIQQKLVHIDGPLKIKQFGDGQSNPTYLLISPSGQRHVLRKQPPGSLVSGTAHRIDREFTVLKALERTEVPVPRALHMCHDATVLGTPFYVMEYLDGRVITDPFLVEVKEEDRYKMWQDAARVLGKIHSINIEAVGLGTFGKTSAFYIRQLKTFSKISAAQQQVKDPRTGRLIEPVLYFKDLVDFYENDRHAPGDRSTLIHGDYRIGNLIWHKTEPRVIGVLDWELSTIGHPLSDVASLIDPYSRACFGIQHKRQDITSTMRNRGLDGIPDLSLIIRWYTEVAGWNPDSHLWWGSSFHAFRDAIIMQGIMARMAAGQASGGSSALSHAARMKPDAERAWKIAQALLKPVSSKL